MQDKTIAIVGHPNCGKTSLFNQLTGNQKTIGNWSGVTVSKQLGNYVSNDTKYTIIDLPGCYSWTKNNIKLPIDEQIACQYLTSQQADLIINVVDVNKLSRQLNLSQQLIEHRLPVLIVINMMGIKDNTSVDIEALAKEIKCHVIALEANQASDVATLKKIINKNIHNINLSRAPIVANYPAKITEYIQTWQTKVDMTIKNNSPGLMIRAIEGEDIICKKLQDADIPIYNIRQKISSSFNQPIEIVIATARQQASQAIVKAAQLITNNKKQNIQQYIDNIVLNRWLGLPIFLFIMYIMFICSIRIGGLFQEFFEITAQALWGLLLNNLLPIFYIPDNLISLLITKAGLGISVIASFIPVIGAMFMFLAWLEGSGYIARAAFVVDRIMRLIGLPGKSFVPLIIGFGCNVPAVLSTRTLSNDRERILTIMMSPFMSCGARLAIYAVFVAAFFPQNGQNIIFMLYLLGILVAILTGKILQLTILPGDTSCSVMELPPYMLPKMASVLKVSFFKLKNFILKAGKIIIPVCLIISILNGYGLKQCDREQSTTTPITIIGSSLTPLFAPMGIQKDNWPATVGLLTGVLAKEVVIGTLKTLYTNELITKENHQLRDNSYYKGLFLIAFQSISDNLHIMPSLLFKPLSIGEGQHEKKTLQEIHKRFGSKAAAIAYLVFVLLYMPCISVIAVMSKEATKSWAIFSMLWTTSLAYLGGILCYQVLTINEHPASSIMWITGIISGFVISISCVNYYLNYKPYKDLPTKIVTL